MTTLTRHRLFHDPTFPSSETLDDTQRALVADFNHRIAAGELAFVASPCLCGCEAADLVATYDRFRVQQPIVLCRACGMLRCDPRMADSTIEEFYSSDLYRQLYNSSTVLPQTPEKFLARAAINRRRFDTITKTLGELPASVAEIGCGAGWNLWEFHQQGSQVVGCDYSRELTEAGRSMGMDIRQGPVSTLGEQTFDVIILSHVVEHMPDPLGEIRKILRHLTPQGHLFIEVPDARDFCLGALQSAHLWYFTPSHLAHLMASLGFSVHHQESYGGVHFSLLMKADSTPAYPDLSGERRKMLSIIAAFERRQRLISALDAIGLLSFARRMLNR